MSLQDRIKKTSKIKETAIMSKSKVYGKKDMISTPIPMLNVAFSGRIDGGFQSGITTFAGPSKHFKTMFALVCAKSFLDKYDDGVLLFYDSEFGSPPEYFESCGIDLARVVHIPIKNIEEMKFDLVNQLEQVEKSDNVMIVIDSVGNLASKKELDDALNNKSVEDMTRAKKLKGFFRMITPYMTLKDIPMIAISHTYKEISMYPKDIVGGGTGGIYASDNIFIIGRRQEKEGKEVISNDFMVRVEKSRFVREGSVIPISVSFEHGIRQFSGLLDIALEGGYVVKPLNGWFQRANPSTGEVLEEEKHRRKDTLSKDFWSMVFSKTDFAKFIETKYKIANSKLIQEEPDDIREDDHDIESNETVE